METGLFLLKNGMTSLFIELPSIALHVVTLLDVNYEILLLKQLQRAEQSDIGHIYTMNGTLTLQADSTGGTLLFLNPSLNPSCNVNSKLVDGFASLDAINFNSLL